MKYQGEARCQKEKETALEKGAICDRGKPAEKNNDEVTKL